MSGYSMYSPLADSFLVLIILAAYSCPVEIFMHLLTTEKAPLHNMKQRSVTTILWPPESLWNSSKDLSICVLMNTSSSHSAWLWKQQIEKTISIVMHCVDHEHGRKPQNKQVRAPWVVTVLPNLLYLILVCLPIFWGSFSSICHS